MTFHDYGTVGPNGLTLGHWYAIGDRRMMCVADDAKGIWLFDPAKPSNSQLANWEGSRAEFDAAGWTPFAYEIVTDR